MTTYYDENRDKLIANQRAYYHTNKDKINEKARKSKIICECGSSIPKGHEKRHYDTKKHQNFMSNKSEYSSPCTMIEEARNLFYYDVQTFENNTENNTKSENLSL